MSDVSPLSYTDTTIKEINYSQLQTFLTEAFGRTYEVAYLNGWSNDTCYKIRVTGNELDQYSRREVDDFISGTKYDLSAHNALEYLCAQGIVEPGLYLIDVCW